MDKQTIRDAIQAFYPIAVVVVFTPVLLVEGYAWVGILIAILLFVLVRTWWTCIFGLLNWLFVLAMLIACSIPYLEMILKR